MEVGFKAVLGQSIQEPIKAATAFGLGLIVSWRLTLFIVIFEVPIDVPTVLVEATEQIFDRLISAISGVCA